MTFIYNPQQLQAAENTFISALAFSTGNGILTATRNDGVQLTTDLDDRYVQENTHTTSATFESTNGILTLNQTDPIGTVTVDLNGRFPTDNTHLNSASLGIDNVLSLGMVNPTSTITVNLSSLADLNTHLDSATFDSGTKKLTLNLVNPSSQIIVDLEGIEGENTHTTSATFNTVDGVLTLNQTDPIGTVTVDLDGRFATQNTHLDDVSFNSTTRELKLDMVNPSSEFKVTIDGGADENTFLTSLAFNKDSGALNATLNTGTIVSTDLDGRYITASENTHLNSATYDTDTGILSLGVVNPTNNIDVTIETGDKLNTHLDSAALDDKTLELNMVNPSSQISVDLAPVLEGDFLPIDFKTAYTGNLNDLVSPGVYTVSSTAFPIPDGLEGALNMVAVFSKIEDGESLPQACTQIFTNGTNQFNGLNPNCNMWIRVISLTTSPIISVWQPVTVSGLSGFLRGPLTATPRDFNETRFRISGWYYVGHVGGPEGYGWDNGPANFPYESHYNVLQTVNILGEHNGMGYGFQELNCADGDSHNSEIRKFRRTFEASESNVLFTGWVEFSLQGIPIEIEAQKVTNSIDSREIIDVTNVRVLNLQLGISYAIRTFNGGVEGQVITIIKTVNTGFVRIWHWDSTNGGNIVTPSGAPGSANLRYNRSCSFIKVGTYWYPYNWESSSS